MQKIKIFTSALLIVLLASCFNRAFAQQDAQFSHYMFNKLYFNPATAGLDEDKIEFQLFHRSQWLGYVSTLSPDSVGPAPNTQVFTFNLPLSKYRSGLGLHLVNDVRGPLQTIEAQASYAYHVKLNKGRKLSFGVRGGIYSLSIRRDWLRPNDIDDPLIQSLIAGQRKNTPDFAAGAYYSTPKFFMGIGFNHLTKSDFEYSGGFQVNKLQPHGSLLIGYNINLNANVVLTPSAVVKTDLNTYSFEANGMLTFNDKIWAALAYRETEAAVLMFGVNLLKDKSMRLGYAFEYTTNGRKAKQPTSHELMLTYRIPGPKWLVPSIIRTPRFRHD